MGCSSSSYPTEPVMDKPRSKFRIGQYVEAYGSVIGEPFGLYEDQWIRGRIEDIVFDWRSYYYTIRDHEGDRWSANELYVRRPQEVPTGWEPKESK